MTDLKDSKNLAGLKDKLRDQLIEAGKLQQGENSNLLHFTENVSFNSPSAASAVILDSNDNGRTSWKVEQTGQTYQEWSEKQVEDAVGELTRGDDISERDGS
jgi:hypothetical protein